MRNISEQFHSSIIFQNYLIIHVARSRMSILSPNLLKIGARYPLHRALLSSKGLTCLNTSLLQNSFEILE